MESRQLLPEICEVEGLCSVRTSLVIKSSIANSRNQSGTRDGTMELNRAHRQFHHWRWNFRAPLGRGWASGQSKSTCLPDCGRWNRHHCRLLRRGRVALSSDRGPLSIREGGLWTFSWFADRLASLADAHYFRCGGCERLCRLLAGLLAASKGTDQPFCHPDDSDRWTGDRKYSRRERGSAGQQLSHSRQVVAAVASSG